MPGFDLAEFVAKGEQLEWLGAVDNSHTSPALVP
jgi:hypothetical protein